MTDTSAATPAQLGYNDLPGLVAVMTGDEKHAPSADSTLDVLWVLYDRVLNVSPANLHDPDRDRFLLSKGHGPMSYYAVLAAMGFIEVATLATFGAYDSALGHHPDRMLIPGVEISSGSLGHGLPIGVGVALGLRAQQRAGRVVVLVGDAELDEGSNHEAIAVAGRLVLDHLTVVVVDNRTATHGWPGGIESRFENEGWASTTVDGRDHDALEAALSARHVGQPNVVVAVVESGS
jgi:transketolase